MNEQLISLETSKLAKEKGFDRIKIVSKNNIEAAYNAPTQSLLQKWIREVHNIHINIDYGCGITLRNEYYQYSYSLEDINKAEEEERFEQFAGEIYPTYEASLEAGLYNALLLIK